MAAKSLDLQLTALRKLRKAPLVLVCAGVIAWTLMACDGGTSIKGVVLDSADKPIVNANIKLAVGRQVREAQSSEHGVFKVGTLHSPWNPELTLSITKQGYRPFEKRFHADEHLQSIVVTLQNASDIGAQEQPANTPESTRH